MKYILFLLIFVSLVCGAAVYMQANPDGSVSYSIRLRLTRWKSPYRMVVQCQRHLRQCKQKKESRKYWRRGARKIMGPMPYLPYTSFTISSPQDQQTFQNQRDIPVEFG